MEEKMLMRPHNNRFCILYYLVNLVEDNENHYVAINVFYKSILKWLNIYLNNVANNDEARH